MEESSFSRVLAREGQGCAIPQNLEADFSVERELRQDFPSPALRERVAEGRVRVWLKRW